MTTNNALIVEDDPDIRGAMIRTLRLLGFETQGVINGREALDLLNKQEFIPSVILSDHDMPLVNGSELYRLICQVHPTLKSRFILMTGNDRLKNFADDNAIPFLISKPFSTEDLEAAIKRALS